MLAITVDVDWAPDPIVDAVVELFENQSVPITLFCTDPDTDRSGNSSSLANRYHRRNEIALHPNFSADKSPDRVLSNLLQHYPNAIGLRSHNGSGNFATSTLAAERGVRYQVEAQVFPVDVPPFRSNPWAMDLHIFVTRFMDSWALPLPRYAWNLSEAGLTRAVSEPDAIFIMAFHPVIIYYDTTSVAEYLRRKETYHEVSECDSFLHKRSHGPVKLIKELLDSIEPQNFTTIRDFGNLNRLWD